MCLRAWVLSERRADEVIDCVCVCVSADGGKPVRTLYSLRGQFYCAALVRNRNEWKRLKF